jgi:ribosomal protein S18 acetylase RimI-like enzyme
VPSVPEIRRATASDAPKIADLLGELGYSVHPSFILDRLTLLHDRGDACVLVAEAAESVIGVVTVHLFPLFHADVWTGRITALVVSAHHRRRGIGTLLLDAGEAFAWAARCTRVEVTSGGTHEPAPQFYEGHGYERLDQHLVKMRP